MQYTIQTSFPSAFFAFVTILGCSQQKPALPPSPSDPIFDTTTHMPETSGTVVSHQQILLLESKTTAKIPRPGQWPGFSTDDQYQSARHAMVRVQIKRRGVDNEAVLDAMRRVPRHLFIPESDPVKSYGDYPVPIGYGQTISQPYIVAIMTQLLDVGPDDRILEIGTGSGYQAAILAEICREVVSIEIVDQLAKSSAKRIEDMGYMNITVICGDGYLGYPPRAPYDGIIITAAVEPVPPLLVGQLVPGGRIVVPLGNPGRGQDLTVLEKQEDGTLKQRKVLPVRFVPFTRKTAE